MTTLPTDNLAELIHRKHQVLLQLREVGHRQIEIVDRHEISSLLQLLAAKQQLISALQTVERELAPYRDEDPDRRQWRSIEDRTRCAEEASACNELLSEIVHLEKRSEEKMATRRNQVATQLQEVHSAARARGAYAAHRDHAQLHSPHVGALSPSDLPTQGTAATPSPGIDLVSDG